MITSIILFFGGILIWIIGSVLKALTFTLPANFTNAIEYWFSTLKYTDVLLPIETLMQALGIFVTFLIFWYSAKIIMWTYHVIRHGGDVDFPVLGSYSKAALETKIDRDTINTDKDGNIKGSHSVTVIKKGKS